MIIKILNLCGHKRTKFKFLKKFYFYYNTIYCPVGLFSYNLDLCQLILLIISRRNYKTEQETKIKCLYIQKQIETNMLSQHVFYILDLSYIKLILSCLFVIKLMCNTKLNFDLLKLLVE